MQNLSLCLDGNIFFNEVNDWVLIAPYVECRIFETGIVSIEDCNDFQIEVKEINNTNTITEEEICEAKNSNGCTFYFNIDKKGSDNPKDLSVLVHLQENGLKEICPVNYLSIALPVSVFAAILIFGLIGLLVYKAYNEIQDRREYAQFKRNLENVKGAVNINPLHKPPITTYMNPTYEKIGLKQRYDPNTE